MAQIMKYWQHPASGTGSSTAYSTTTQNISVPSVSFNTSYDYANMLNNYTTNSGTTTQRDAVAKLMYHSGVSVQMDYSSAASGARAYDIAEPLTQHFGYDNNIMHIFSSNSSISANDWKDLVIGQIENSSPVVYGGTDNSAGGHVFIIDGYNNVNGTFHINWGWGGDYDGFFPLTALNPNTYAFNSQTLMLVNIMPNQGGNPPSQIKVSSFDVSTTETAVTANIRAKMNYGADFSGKIGFAVISDNTVSMVLDSADYSISNTYDPQYGEYTVNYADAQLGREIGSDIPSGNLTLSVVTKRGTGAWTPAGETSLISIQGGTSAYTVSFNLNGGSGTTPAAITNVSYGNTLGTAQRPSVSNITRLGYTNDGKWYTRTGTTEANYVYTEFMFGTIGTPIVGDITLYLKWIWTLDPWDCGITPETVTATLSDNGTFTIRGTGAMANYASSSNVPWYDFRDFINNVIISNGVTTIGQYAFYGYTGLTSVTIPVSVTSIGQYSFYGCTGLTSVTIPSSVTSLGNGAFYGCTGLMSMVIPNSVTSIGNRAFMNCNNLKSVTIGASVTSIRDSTFMSCTGLTSVTIPNSVTSIGRNAFYNCRDLTLVTIGNGLTSIGNYAFSGCTGLTSVALPNSVTSIGNSAFSGCSGLTLMAIPTGVTSIGSSAFQGCTGLTSLTIPTSVISIRDSTFMNCAGLTLVTIPNNVTSVGNSAFYGCAGLTSMMIPNSVTSIGNSAFSGCTGLTLVTIPNNVTSIGQNAFVGCSSLKTIISLRVTPPSIGAGAFSNVSASACLYVPETAIDVYNSTNVWSGISCIEAIDGALNVTFDSQGGSAVNTQYALSGYRVVNPAAPTRSDYVFGGWYKVAACTEPWVYNDLVTSDITLYAKWWLAGEALEWDCGAISGTVRTVLLIESGTLTISGTGAMANYNISDVPWYNVRTSITGVVIEEGVTSIGQDAFSGCSGLTSLTIGNSVTSIGSSAFSGCSGLTSLTIPTSVTSIGDRAFYGCAGLTSLTIGNSVTSIGQEAFSYCTGLTSLTIGNSVTSIGQSAFSGCSGLTNIEVGEGNTAYSSVDGVLFNKSKTTLVQYPRGKQGTTYNIPNSVTTIGQSAFSGCSGLTSVTIPNSVTSLGDYAFSVCSGLMSMTIGNSVTSIGQSAFSGCSGLTSMTIPNSETSIGSGAFEYCRGLTSVTIPNSVTSIENSAFSYCNGLTSVSIPNSVDSIGREAFSYCTGLTSVTIPSSVTSIGEYAFTDCRGLTSVTSLGMVPPNAGSYAFRDVPGCLLVPETSIEAYRSANIWKDFRCIQTTGTWTQAWDCGVTPGTVTATLNEEGTLTINGTGAMADYTSSSPVPWYNFRRFIADVVINDGVTSIGNGAFYSDNWSAIIAPTWSASFNDNYNDLTSVTIGNSVSSIGESAFYNCTGLTSVTIGNSVTSIGYNEFYDCSGLKSLAIPNSVTSIGGSAFSGCTGLTSLTIGNSVTSIGSNAFYDCTDLTSVTIGNSVTSIGEEAFRFCTSLTSVTIPNSVDSIGREAFSYCTGLTSVTIGNSVTSIGEKAFSYCTSLTSVISLRQIPPSVDYDVFGIFSGYIISSACLYVPQAAISAYSSAYTWRDFACIKSTNDVSVLTPDRVIPQTKPKEEATVIAPVTALSGEFTAGPNPVAKQSGIVNFFRQGKRVSNSELRIYDATGNVISKVKINDKALNSQAKRIVGSWDLKDTKGRLLSEGTYLVKGVVKTSDGKSEKVSVILGVR
jgi:uncharacterized repeat protein (TIGR02543 family)